MEAFSQWAMPEGERVELNRDEYVRPAFPERVTAWAALFGIHDEATGQRAVTIDEIRAAERLNANSVQASAAVR